MNMFKPSRAMVVVIAIGALGIAGGAGPAWAAQAATEGAEAQPPTVVETESPVAWRRPAFWSAVGGAVAAAGLGVYAHFAAGQNIDDFNSALDSDGQPVCNESFPGYGGPACQSAHERGGRWRTATLVALGSSLVLTTAAVVLKLTEPSAQSPVLERVSLGWTPGGGASASYRLRF